MTTYQQRTFQGKTTLIDPAGTWFSVVLSFGPLGPAQYQKMCRTLTEAETWVREHGWPIPLDELAEAR